MSHSQHVLFKASSAWEVAAPTLPIYSAKKAMLIITAKNATKREREGEERGRSAFIMRKLHVARHAVALGMGT